MFLWSCNHTLHDWFFSAATAGSAVCSTDGSGETGKLWTLVGPAGQRFCSLNTRANQVNQTTKRFGIATKNETHNSSSKPHVFQKDLLFGLTPHARKDLSRLYFALFQSILKRYCCCRFKYQQEEKPWTFSAPTTPAARLAERTRSRVTSFQWGECIFLEHTGLIRRNSTHRAHLVHH